MRGMDAALALAMSDAPPTARGIRREPHVNGSTSSKSSMHRRRVRALECRVEAGTIAIPVDAVGQIVEYDVSPLPLARGAVRGLGLVDGKLVVSLGIGRCADGRRHTKGVLLRTAEASGHWALEVVEVLSFIEVAAPSAHGGGTVRVATDDARDLRWIDADRLVAEAGEPFFDGAVR
jgi:hypothetical protein